MSFDIVVPSTLFVLTALSVYLYPKLEAKVKAILEERKFRMRDVALLVVLMGVAVTVMVFIPAYAILALFLIFYSIALFTFTYTATSKWYIAFAAPAIFLLLYFFFWGVPQMDLFAAIFVVFISAYIGTFFEWKTVAVFAALITIMDVIQVFITRFMVTSAQKITDLGLPVLIRLPTFPYMGSMGLGLGDFFLAGLLTIQTAKKYGRRFGYVSIAIIAGAFLVFQAFQLWYFEFLKQSLPLEEASSRAAMPATVFIVSGWLIALGIRYAYNFLTTKKSSGETQ